MDAKTFVNSIYLGDRFCKKIVLDGYEGKVKIQVNMISRIRSSSGNWEFYNDENIEDGYIVFSDVESIYFEPQGRIPDGEIEISNVELLKNDGELSQKAKYLFEISSVSYDKTGNSEDIVIKIVAHEIYIIDPRKPDERITN